MSRYEKVLNSRVILLCLLGLAGWLVVSESYLWWAKLSESKEQTAALQQNTADTALDEDSRALLETSTDNLDDLNLEKQATFDQVSNLPEGVFKYGGSTTWAPLREKVNPVLSNRFSAFQVQYTSPAADSGQTAGSGTGIRMLLDGELAFAQSSRPLKEEERAEAKRNGYALKQVAIAVDGIAVAVNPDLDVAGLSVEQLKQIYKGEVTNWRELGGPNLEILPYARSVQDSGTAEFFLETVLDGAQYAPWVQFVESPTAGLRQIADNPGGIYYASAPEVVGQCSIKPLHLSDGEGEFASPYEPPYVQTSDCPRYRNRLNAQAFQSGEYPLTRELFVVVKANGAIEEQAGLAYASLMLTDEAKALIELAGFVSAIEQP